MTKQQLARMKMERLAMEKLSIGGMIHRDKDHFMGEDGKPKQ